MRHHPDKAVLFVRWVLQHIGGYAEQSATNREFQIRFIGQDIVVEYNDYLIYQHAAKIAQWAKTHNLDIWHNGAKSKLIFRNILDIYETLALYRVLGP